MQDSDKFSRKLADSRQLDLLGGEPLEGSGFEREQSDPEFAAEEISAVSEEA